MKRLLVLFTLGLVLGLFVPRIAHAQDAGPLTPGPIAVPEFIPSNAGSATPPAADPASQLHNPVDSPIASIDDAKQAYKQNWALGILAVLVMLIAGLSKAASKWPTLPGLSYFSKHKTLMLVISGAGLTAAAAYNSLALGGSWYATLAVAGGAALALISPKAA